MQHIATLERLAGEGASKEVLDYLCDLVPTYQPARAVDGCTHLQIESYGSAARDTTT